MANPREQILPTSGNNALVMSTPDANGQTAYATMGRDVAQGQLWVLANGKQQFIMGVQARSVRQSNGGRFLNSAGNDWLEPVFSQRAWGGTVNRWVPRGEDLEQIVRALFNNSPLDIDFRQLPLQFRYIHNYQSSTGVTIDNASWDYMTAFVTDYELSEPDATGKQMESFTWIGKGLQRSSSGTSTTGNNGVLWFSQSQAPSTQSASAAQSSAVSTGTGIVTGSTDPTGSGGAGGHVF